MNLLQTSKPCLEEEYAYGLVQMLDKDRFELAEEPGFFWPESFGPWETLLYGPTIGQVRKTQQKTHG